MPQRQISDLRDTLATFKRMIEAQNAAKARLVEKRAEAFTSEQIAKLDQMLAINGRTLDALKRAAESFERELALLERTDREATSPM
jgi:hypothetical protein